MSQQAAQLSFIYGLIAITVFLLPGCGKKTMPVPPQTVLPATISDLSYLLDENGVTLTWSWPRKTELGRELQAIDGFELIKAVVPIEDYCPGCPIPFKRPAKIEVEPRPDATQPKTARYTEKNLKPGHRYLYRIKTRIGWQISSLPSNTVSFVWAIPPSTPQGLHVKTGDSSLELSWLPVTTMRDSSPISRPPSYQVYRSPDGKDFSPLGEPVSTNKIIDRGVKNDSRYFYRIRAFIERDGTKSGSAVSSIAEGTPIDLTPPAVPKNIKAVKTPEGIKLFWDRVAATDLAGYRVYRRSGSSPFNNFKLLSEVREKTGFIDQDAPSHINTWYYTITAFDQAIPANESNFSKQYKFERMK